MNQPPQIPSVPQSPNVNYQSYSNAGYAGNFPEAQAAPFTYIPPVYQAAPLPSQIYYTPPMYQSWMQPQWSPPVPVDKNATTLKIVAGVGGGLLGLVILFALVFASLAVGPMGAVIATGLAGIPFLLITLSLMWVGKWDKEPWGLKLGAVVWGGGVAVVLTFLITALSDLIFGKAPNMLIASSVQAPFIEEFCKGLGVLLIALFLKKYLSTPVDGVVYIASIAGGFAFTENILYFSQAIATGGLQSLGFTFFLRAILSPFTHIIFSLPMGILVGFGAHWGYRNWQIFGLWFIGYVPAVLLHALWNGSSNLISADLWFIFYIVVQIPLFAGAFFAVIWLRQSEIKNTFKRLTEYGWAGWFTPQEVYSFATWDGRNQSLKWAKLKAPHAVQVMKDVAKDVVALANIREKIVRNRATPSTFVEEKQLLDRLVLSKNYLNSI